MEFLISDLPIYPPNVFLSVCAYIYIYTHTLYRDVLFNFVNLQSLWNNLRCITVTQRFKMAAMRRVHETLRLGLLCRVQKAEGGAWFRFPKRPMAAVELTPGARVSPSLTNPRPRLAHVDVI